MAMRHATLASHDDSAADAEGPPQARIAVSEALLRLVTVVGDHDGGPFTLTRVGSSPVRHSGQDLAKVLVDIDNGVRVLLRCAAVHMTVLVDSDEVGEKEGPG
jgi:hypothetical protein